ncbi:MAG: DUF92 domain-containing protein [Flavisolibacter sp.]|jgi:uncharacterized protein (TIGR00297 family)|nr:DUF92 domain-containing protein [Flavisolibacter sp.]
MDFREIILLIIVLAGMYGAVTFRKLSIAGSVSGGIITFFIYCGAGVGGFISMSSFFVMATLATSYRRSVKQRFLQTSHQPRDAFQVWANAGIAALAGVVSFFSDHHLVIIIIYSVLSSASADTISSEMGMVHGKKFFNILDFQPAKKGDNGVVSLEGTAWGLLASVVIGSIYVLIHGFNTVFFIIIIAGMMGNLFDSLLGATLERDGKLGNNAVNFLNTCFASVIAVLLYGLLPLS